MPSSAPAKPREGSGQPRPPNSAEREQINFLREVFLHAPGIQDRYMREWDEIKLEDRRTLLALAGVDDSEESACRKWPQLLEKDRAAILTECRHLGQVVRPFMTRH